MNQQLINPEEEEEIEGKGEIKSRGEIEVEKKARTKAEFEKAQFGNLDKPPIDVNKPAEEQKSENEKEQEEEKAPEEEEEAPEEESSEEENPEEEQEQEEQPEEPPEDSGEQPPEEQEEDQPESSGAQAQQEGEKLNWYNKIKKQALDRWKKMGEWGKKNLSKEGLKRAGSIIWKFLVAYWPYVLAAAIIFFLIILLASSCSRQTGKMPLQALDKVKDKKLQLRVLAEEGDVSAKRELIGLEAIDAKKDLQKISTDNADAQKIIAQINQYLDEIVALGDSPEAVSERIKQILGLLDKLKTLLPNYASTIDQITNRIQGISKLLDFLKRGHLVMNPIDVEHLRNFEGDRRIYQMLDYLVTPKDQNGAGHERIRVKRVFFSYDTERKSPSKETDYSEKDEPNVSAHFTGQAADISEIDCINCTQIKKRRLASDTKTKLPPIPIKVAWQTEQGYMKAGGPQIFGENMHQVFNNLGSGAIDDLIIGQVSDILGVDLDPNQIKGKSMQEIARYVGTAMLKENLDIPGDYELGNNLEDISNNIGRAYLAEALGVPIEGIRGTNPDELSENIGRAEIETRMRLPAGSLSGNNSGEIFASVGRRKIEESLQLSRDTLAVPFGDADAFRRNLGQGKVESSLGIKSRTFYGASIDDFKKRAGKPLFDMTFANPSVIDNWLGIAGGTTESLVNGEISPDTYNKIVGDKVFDTQISVYQNVGKRAEVFGTESADFEALINGDQGTFVAIGKTTIAHGLTVSDQDQRSLRTWFDTRQKPAELDEDYIAGQYGLKEGDLGKIFVDDLAGAVFSRVGKVQVMNNLANNSSLSPYLDAVKDYRFYSDRLNIIHDNFQDLEKTSSDPEIRAKAAETKDIVSGLLKSLSINTIRENTKQIQANIKFIKERAATTDPQAFNKIKAIEKAVNEIIEGKEINDYNSLSAGTINSRTNPQVGLNKSDIIGLLMGTKTIDDLVYSIGLLKWETELDLPQGSLKNAFTALRSNGFANADDILLTSIGKAKVDEYGGIGGRSSSQVDRDLGLPSGTTADFRAGKITQDAYYKKVGMGSTNGIAANLLNGLFDLTGDANYALQGSDVTNMLNGGWFNVVLKIGGRAIDDAMGFPRGGTVDIINQNPGPGDVLGMLAEQKLGFLAGLDRPVSINGDIPYNLGLVKIEQYLGLRRNELSEGNLVDRVRGFTGENDNSLSNLDMSLGVAPGDSKKLINGGVSPHDYIVKVGNFLKDSTIYDQIANYSPALQNPDLKAVVMALAEKTGSPQDILEAAGAKQVGTLLGLDYAVSIRGNFKDNLGAAKIEDRLGLKPGSFRDNIDTVVQTNGLEKFESAFYIARGQLGNARNGGSGYWNEDHINQANLVDAVLNVPAGSTRDFLTGAIDLAAYVDRVGQSSLTEVTVDKLADLMQLDDKYKTMATTLVDVFNTDPSLSSTASKQKLFNALMGVGGWNLDNMTKFDPGTWQRILFVDPDDPDHTGLKNGGSIVLEQGKKWLPKWMGLDPKYEPYIDLIYEKGSGINNEREMTAAIQTITGIPDANDAKRFLSGDIQGGLTAWGAAQIVANYNAQFGDQGFTIDYATAKKAYFNDPEGETAIGDAAVDKARAAVAAEGGTLSTEDEANIRENAIRDARDNARKDLQFKVIDMQLHKYDKNIPAGFTQAMREGTAEQKWAMGLTYIGNMVHEGNPAIPAELLPELQRYFDPNSAEYHKISALSGASYAFFDTQMKSVFGDFVQPGTAKALFLYGETGKLGSPSEQGTLTAIYANYGVGIVTNWADKQFNLPIGTTKLIWDSYTKYQAAKTAMEATQAARIVAYSKYAATYNAATGTYDAAAYANYEKAAIAEQQSQAALNGLKADLIATVINYTFQKQLAAMDQKLGLVPGSSAMLVTMTTQYLIAGSINPWVIGLFVITNLFGVYDVDVVCSACGYYPEAGTGIFAKLTNQPSNLGEPGCPLGDFDGKSEESFRRNAVLAAQWKVNQLIGDTLKMSAVLKDENLLPTQIMTLRQEDVDSYSSVLTQEYGTPAARMNSGMWANEITWDYIHIGY